MFENCKIKQWIITEKSSNFIIDKNPKNAIYRLNNIEFNREWFLKIKNDTLQPDKVFAIDNAEHRRIAYEFMDKSKMKSLKDYKILNKTKDSKGNDCKIISFTVQNMKTPLLFYNVLCPSTKREYFLQVDIKTCIEAKNRLFGKENIEFTEEW